MKVWFMIIILSHYFWSLNKWEAHMQTVVIPTPFTWFGCKYVNLNVSFIWNPLWWCIEPKMLELCRCPNIYGPDCITNIHCYQSFSISLYQLRFDTVLYRKLSYGFRKSWNIAKNIAYICFFVFVLCHMVTVQLLNNFLKYS